MTEQALSPERRALARLTLAALEAKKTADQLGAGFADHLAAWRADELSIDEMYDHVERLADAQLELLNTHRAMSAAVANLADPTMKGVAAELDEALDDVAQRVARTDAWRIMLRAARDERRLLERSMEDPPGS